MRSLLLSSLLLLSAVNIAHAEYRHEVTGSLVESEHWDRLALKYSFYFQPVKTTRGPWQLSAFLDPQHEVHAELYDADYDDNHLILGGTYVLDSFTFGAEFDNGFDYFALDLGFYLDHVSKVNLLLSEDCEACDTSLSIAYRRYHKLDAVTGLDIRAAYNNLNDSDRDHLMFGADYYFNDVAYAGADVKTDFDDSDLKINAGYWFRQEVGMNLSYMLDAEIFYLDVKGRF